MIWRIGIQDLTVKLLERIIDTASRLFWISHNQPAEELPHINPPLFRFDFPFVWKDGDH
jgi:hypothetical protein